MVTQRQLENKLKEVLDPELGINIVDLGLVYDFKVKKDQVFILMTLTFPGCPLGATIREDINRLVGSLEGIKKVNLEITFDPPWDLTKMSEEAKAELELLRNV